ncbi:hypothetical protein ATE49_05715 [Elizabethkingia miricola]|uniref:DUF4105 domain-containing protein n=1 Tax=Elizabethkingia miricola TaxID=172045 RepID=A0ABY3NLA4_ELIMR|nr:hypothetical protein [Elizabethkingia miricola]OBS12322.1 hypothetical protein ATE49_05715 [Elizabethkingia miricola]TYO94261.1 hypothetical protein LX74_00301 [Elizabethkingia miricola]
MDESVGVIRLDVASQTFGEDKKAIIFPVTDGNGKVTSAWYGIINEERSYVNFSYMNDNSAKLADIKKVFQNYYDKKNKGSLSSGAIASISKQINPVALKNGNEQKPIDIEEVVITKKNPTTPPPDQWVPKYPDEPSGGGGAGSSGPGTGMSGGSSTYGGSMAMPPPPKNPINDLKKYLECLDSRQPANIKVYANTTGMIGHAFISIQQGFNIRTFGFYPEQSFPQNVDGPGIMGDNSGDHYDAVLNMGSVSPEQLQHILRKASEYNDRAYSLYYSNCANFAMDVMQIIKPSIQESKWEKPGTVQDQIEKNGGAKQSGEGPVTHVNCN